MSDPKERFIAGLGRAAEAVSGRQGKRETPFDRANTALLCRIPSEQLNYVFSDDRCEIEPRFLGFVDVYAHLAEIIPKHFAVVDLGCSHAAQAFLFEEHREYVGVDISDCNRFAARNTRHVILSVAEFLDNHGSEFDLDETFAICSYVPPWAGDNCKMVRDFFPNCFVFYPSNKAERRAIAARMLGAMA